MEVIEYLQFVGRLKGVPKADVNRRAEEVAERCRVADVRTKLIGKLSKGYRQRVGLAFWLATGATNAIMAVSIGLIIGGALANALDRLHLGGVADFFSLHAFGFYWYVFNIADVAIVAGVAGLLYDSFWPSRNDAAK